MDLTKHNEDNNRKEQGRSVVADRDVKFMIVFSGLDANALNKDQNRLKRLSICAQLLDSLFKSCRGCRFQVS